MGIKPYWYQDRTLESKARYIVMLGGTGGGKTWWGPVWLAHKIAADHKAGLDKNEEEARYLALGPTSEMARDTMLPKLEKHYAGTKMQGEWLAMKRMYKLRTGAEIYFRSAEAPTRIEGHHFRAAWIDEPGQMKRAVWPIIQRRTDLHSAQVLFTGYPTSMNWYYHEIFKRWQAGDPNYDVIQFKSTDNPDYPQESYDRAKDTMAGWLFDMTYRGIFRKPAGVVYPEFGEHLFVDPFDIPPGTPVYVGLDPSVFYGGLFLAWINGTYYAYTDYYTEELAEAAVHAEALNGKVRGEVRYWIYDPARLTDVNELKRYGIGPLVPANNAVIAGIGTVTGFIKSGRLRVMRRQAPDLVDQVERYSWPTDPVSGTIAKENPIKKDDHLPDCLRYILHTLEGAPAAEPKKEVIATYYDPVNISPM